MLRREDEALPTSEEMADRRRLSLGLVRPELSVLVAYAKRLLTEQLLASGIPEDPAFDPDVLAYFPGPVTDRFGDLVAEHPLRRELVATLVANDVVDSLGPTFVTNIARELGAEASSVVRCYRIARDVTGATTRWLAIESEGSELSQQTQAELMSRCSSACPRWSRSPAGTC